jgi:hypothetical protein
VEEITAMSEELNKIAQNI